MTELRRQHAPPLGLGLASVTLGAMGLALFLLPVLGVPISAAGLALGVVGVIVAAVRQSRNLSLAFAGVVVCALALIVSVTSDSSPTDYLDPRPPPPGVAPLPPRQFVPPPAPFRGATERNMHRLLTRWPSRTPHIT